MSVKKDVPRKFAIRKCVDADGMSTKYFRRFYDVNITEIHQELKDFSTININDIKNRDVLIDKINQVAINTYKAGIICSKIRKERELFRIKFNIKMNELTKAAISRIQNWFESTENMRKQITKDMVMNEICSHKIDGDEYKKLIIEQEELKEIRDNLELMRDIWKNRQSALQTQAGLIKEHNTNVVLGVGV